MTALHDMTAGELLANYKTKKLSPVEAVDAVIAHIEKWEPKLKALYAPDFEGARKAAKASEKRWQAGKPQGALDGVPITIKENIATKGVPVPLGTRGDRSGAGGGRRAGRGAGARGGRGDPRQDHHARLRHAVVGPKLVPSADPQSLEPRLEPGRLERRRWCGRGGGLRPAASRHRHWRLGAPAGVLERHLHAEAQPRPRAGRSAVLRPCHRADDAHGGGLAALLMAELSKPDARDYMSLPPAAIDWSAGRSSPRASKIGLHLDAGSGLPVDAEVKAAVEAAAKKFADAGANIEPVAPFLSPDMLHLQDLFWRVRSWVDFSALSHAKQASVLPFIADWCRGGADVSGATVIKGVANYMAIRAAATRATQPFDYVLSPVSPVPTYRAEWETPTNDVQRPLEHISFTMPYNMSEQPAASINCGYTKEGKPIGLQIAGHRFDDLGVMRISRWFEQARGAAEGLAEAPK